VRVTIDRREFLRLGAVAAVGAAAIRTPLQGLAPPGGILGDDDAPGSRIEEATIAQLQDAMEARRLTARSLSATYVARIDRLDRRGPRLNSILEVNPDWRSIARGLDRERRDGHVRGPLHGIPIVLKDNIDTADGMQSAAGSLALVGEPPAQDSTVAAKLREAGAVLLGKTNLSEWANFRSFHSASGWSGRAGPCRNPYVIDRNPCGSSSGSGIAPSANLVAASIGTETDGSIVCPAHANGVVGLKPTVGLVSRAGIVPIASAQDTAGPHTRTVADAAVVLDAIVSREPDPRDPATEPNRDRIPADYTSFVDPNGLDGARIGVAREGVSGYSEETDAVFEAAIEAIREAGAAVVDSADIPTIGDINRGAEEITVLVFEFRRDLNAYLATRSDVALDEEGFPMTLAGLIDFNLAHEDQELPWFGQEWFEFTESQPFDEATYRDALERQRLLGGRDGIDAALSANNLDAIVAPTGQPAWPIDLVNGDHFLGASSSPAAIAGYPLITVPAGDSHGLPVGLTFMGTAFGEPTLIKVASGFEAATHARRKPEFQPTLPLGGSGRRGRGGGDDSDRERRSQMPFLRQL
jgi:amidase